MISSNVSATLLEILATGILRIRAAGWSGDADRCALEADHIHNLPALIESRSPELLRYYVEVEKPAFADRCAQAKIDVQEFLHLWQMLPPAAEAVSEVLSAR